MAEVSTPEIKEQQACASCKKPASMQCPTCLKLGITEGSFFCQQDCFKAYWSTHKAIHKKIDEGPQTFPGFEFTGPLRPYLQTPRRTVPPSVKRPDYADHPLGVSECERSSKSAQIRALSASEIKRMRKVCQLGREVLDEAAKIIAVGVSCDEIDRVVHEASVVRNCYPSPLNYRGFPKSCCTSVNEVICHGIPDLYRLRDGDIVNVDVSVYHDGMHADLNETFLVGNVDANSRALVKNTYECLMLAIAECKPGVRYRDIGAIISKHAATANFSVVRTYCGHGINDLFHSAPNIPHYAKNKAVGVMAPGHTFTIEPMINAGTWNDEHWPDDWTAVTRDGKRSAQFEHTLLVTETGVEILTARTKASPCGPAWFETTDKPCAGATME